MRASILGASTVALALLGIWQLAHLPPDGQRSQAVHNLNASTNIRDESVSKENGIAARYPGDRGIGKDRAVLFHEDFEGSDTRKWDEKKGPVAISMESPHSGTGCVE